MLLPSKEQELSWYKVEEPKMWEYFLPSLNKCLTLFQAIDKVVQANGRGLTTIKDYTVVNVGKVFRSCGNCSKNGGPRNVIITGLKANGVNADVVGINSNFGDVATISGSCGKGIKHVCQEFTGIVRNGSQESPKVSTTANCKGAQSQAIPAC